MDKAIITIVVFVMLFSTCSSPLPKYPPFSIPFFFDISKWREDSLACNGYRQGIIDNIMTNKSHFLYKTPIDTFLYYFAGYDYTFESFEHIEYIYWREYGYHCEANLNDAKVHRLCIENEPFFAVVVENKRRLVVQFIDGIP